MKVVIKLKSQPRDSESGYKRIHMKLVGLAASEQSQAWVGLLAAERAISRRHGVLLFDFF